MISKMFLRGTVYFPPVSCSRVTVIAYTGTDSPVYETDKNA